ncbi:GNAT family N-acetyltransferase [Salinicoccus halodurans]|uniref:Acetoin dehydrogenase n=1 Tax=Salinicoccus halodurans TaxID=407035 RepID=A0A0F7HL76_9STAP|nr:GNAT family N-acetyltransferase [Salinicoccus halodurans]AKG74297.1 acetoin dehydrogenase [Salinicoccus halodurans]SFK94155.1 acetoin utilization protein AcuA [Salinicoccus halodurans]
MRHKKTYYKEEYDVGDQSFVIEGPLTGEELNQYSYDGGLDAFRPPREQFEAIMEIADLEEGRIIIARKNDHIIGYVTFLHPDPLERWSDGNLPYIMELGAVEVSFEYRSFGLGRRMLQLSMSDDFMENYIIITTEYYWHWDLKNSGLDVYEYKNLMIRLMASSGFEVFQTNDPEITGHPANTLMARIGKNITDDQMMEFDKIRFKNRFFF